MFKLHTLAALATVAMVAAVPARRDNSDARVVQKPNCTTMDDFETVYTQYCPFFFSKVNGTAEDINNQTVTFTSQTFQRGDLNGNNNDTQAVVACLWTVHSAELGPVQEEEDVGGTIVFYLGGKTLSVGGITF